MALRSYQCSNCGANLKVDTYNMSAVCEYCGQTLTLDAEEVSNILSEREKTKQMKTAEEEQTKREEARLKHDTELRKIEADASEFMEGFETVKTGFNTVKTIATFVLIGFILIFIVVVLIIVLKHFG